MIKNLDNGRKVTTSGCGLFGLLRRGDLQAGDFIDVFGGTVQLIVGASSDNVIAVTNPGCRESPVQVIEYHLKENTIRSRICESPAENDFYNKLYWESLS